MNEYCKVAILKEMRIAQQCSKSKRTLIEMLTAGLKYNYFEQQSKAFLPKSPISLQSGGQGNTYLLTYLCWKKNSKPIKFPSYDCTIYLLYTQKAKGQLIRNVFLVSSISSKIRSFVFWRKRRLEKIVSTLSDL